MDRREALEILAEIDAKKLHNDYGFSKPLIKSLYDLYGNARDFDKACNTFFRFSEALAESMTPPYHDEEESEEEKASWENIMNLLADMEREYNEKTNYGDF